MSRIISTAASLIHGSANVESTLKRGQKVRFNGTSGTIKQAGAFHIILENEEGKTVVVPTKMIINKEIIIESGPEPEIPEKRVERTIDEKGRENEITEPSSQPEKTAGQPFQDQEKTGA